MKPTRLRGSAGKVSQLSANWAYSTMGLIHRKLTIRTEMPEGEGH